MNKIYPFKFLDAYTKDDTHIFFGRQEEINVLYEMTFQTNILMVYGASGTGKTSLIQCGLATKFHSHDWLPLTIRRGGNINASIEKTLSDAGGNPEPGTDLVDWMEESTNEAGEITNALPPTVLEKSIKAVYLKYFRPVYLIFDQFEELFILGSEDEQNQFIKTVQEILKIEHPVKMIFSIREEYLGYLYSFEKAVPQLLQKKLRVEPMGLAKVNKVILGVTSYENSNIRLLPSETVTFPEEVFQKIKEKTITRTIQLTYLQVFLDKLYLEITKDETRVAEAVFSVAALSKIGNIDDVLKDFLEEQVKLISQKQNKTYSPVTIETIWKILSPFATLEGTKKPISKAKLLDQMPDFNQELIRAAIEDFVNSRILRYSEETDFYELAHDSLAKRIFEKRSDEQIALLEARRLIDNQMLGKGNAREYFTEKQLHRIEPYKDKLKLKPEEGKLVKDSRKEVDKAKIKKKGMIVIFIAGLLLALVFMIYQFNIAEKNAKAAKAALSANIKTQTVARAKELFAYGDRYYLLKKYDFARDSYQTALDSLKKYPDEPLYKELQIKIETCKKH